MIRHRAMLVFLCCIAAAHQVSAQVDQEHVIASDNHYSAFNVRFDVRQEFTPTLDEVDTVELVIGYPVFPTATSAAVAIREGGVNGEIIGTSVAQELPAFYSGTVLFTFSDPVKLASGQLYALQPLTLAGNLDWLVSVNSLNLGEPGYPRGRLFFGGSLVEGDIDLLFREGIDIPEPAPLGLLLIGLGVIGIAEAVRLRNS
jgi:hypothetical protein